MKIVSLFLKTILPLLILGTGIFIWSKFKELPQVEKKKSGARVEIKNSKANSQKKLEKKGLSGEPVVAHPLKLKDYQITLTSRGVAEAGEELTLTSDIEGKVIEISNKFTVGSVVKKGTILLKVDDSDLQDNLIVAKARVAQAEASLAQELVRAEQALINWDELGYEEAPSDLVLRKPQMRQEQAALDSAIAQVELAKRQLQRVNLIAPFDAIVAERTVSLGERANRGREIGRLISTDYSTISLAISAAEQHHLLEDIHGGKVTFQNALIRENSPEWSGYIQNREPEVDPTSKQLHLIARMVDPYSLNQETTQTLPVGQPVTAKIQGKNLKNVYIVPKSALRGPNKIHIMDTDNNLQPLEITPLLTDEENIIFRTPLEGKIYWVETVLPAWKEGQKLMLKQEVTQASTKEKIKEKL